MKKIILMALLISTNVYGAEVIEDITIEDFDAVFTKCVEILDSKTLTAKEKTEQMNVEGKKVASKRITVNNVKVTGGLKSGKYYEGCGKKTGKYEYLVAFHSVSSVKAGDVVTVTGKTTCVYGLNMMMYMSVKKDGTRGEFTIACMGKI